METYDELNVIKMKTCEISVISNNFGNFEMEDFTHSSYTLLLVIKLTNTLKNATLYPGNKTSETPKVLKICYG